MLLYEWRLPGKVEGIIKGPGRGSQNREREHFLRRPFPHAMNLNDFVSHRMKIAVGHRQGNLKEVPIPEINGKFRRILRYS